MSFVPNKVVVDHESFWSTSDVKALQMVVETSFLTKDSHDVWSILITYLDRTIEEHRLRHLVTSSTMETEW